MQKPFLHFVKPPSAFLAPKVDEAIAFEGRGGSAAQLPALLGSSYCWNSLLMPRVNATLGKGRSMKETIS